MSEASKPDAAKPREWVFGLTTADIAKMLIPFIPGSLIGGGLTGLFNWWLNKKTPHLTVKVQETVRFHGEKNKPAIINFSVTSDGSIEAESVVCTVASSGATFQEIKATPKNVKPEKAVRDGDIDVSLPLLNVGETLNVSILFNDGQNLPDKPDVSVRGKGVVGENSPPRSDYSSVFVSVISTTLAAFAAMVAMMTISQLLLKKSQAEERKSEFDMFDKTYKYVVRQEQYVRVRAIRRILTTASGRLLHFAVKNFPPDAPIPITELARLMGEDEAKVRIYASRLSRSREWGRVELFSRFEDGSLSISAEAHKDVLEILAKTKPPEMGQS
jgi:hypothetical protein